MVKFSIIMNFILKGLLSDLLHALAGLSICFSFAPYRFLKGACVGETAINLLIWSVPRQNCHLVFQAVSITQTLGSQRSAFNSVFLWHVTINTLAGVFLFAKFRQYFFSVSLSKITVPICQDLCRQGTVEHSSSLGIQQAFEGGIALTCCFVCAVKSRLKKPLCCCLTHQLMGPTGKCKPRSLLTKGPVHC